MAGNVQNNESSAPLSETSGVYIAGRETQVFTLGASTMTQADAESSLKEAADKGGEAPIACEKHSAAGSVSQRACVFCGSRVVLYPVQLAAQPIPGISGAASVRALS